METEGAPDLARFWLPNKDQLWLARDLGPVLERTSRRRGGSALLLDRTEVSGTEQRPAKSYVWTDILQPELWPDDPNDLWGLAPRFSSFLCDITGAPDRAPHLLALLSSALVLGGPSAGPVNPVVLLRGDRVAADGLVRALRSVLGGLVGLVPASDRRPWLRLQQEMGFVPVSAFSGRPRGAVAMAGPVVPNDRELVRLGGPGDVEVPRQSRPIEWFSVPAVASVFIETGSIPTPRPSAHLRDRLVPVEVRPGRALDEEALLEEGPAILALLAVAACEYRDAGSFVHARAGLCDMDELESWWAEAEPVLAPNLDPSVVAEFVVDRVRQVDGGFLSRTELVDEFAGWAGVEPTYHRGALFEAVRSMGGRDARGKRPERVRGFGGVELLGRDEG